MSIQNHLSHSLGLKTQEGNKSLATSIAKSADIASLDELIQFIETKPLERLQMDAMLTIAYIAEANPEMVTHKVDFLITKLKDPINRVMFASMIALSHITYLIPNMLYESLPKVIDAMSKGSVVAKDHGYKILVSLYQQEKHRESIFPIILEQLHIAPHNQVGQYTERLMAVLKQEHKMNLIAVLEIIREDLSNESHLKRMNKNLKKLYK